MFTAAAVAEVIAGDNVGKLLKFVFRNLPWAYRRIVAMKAWVQTRRLRSLEMGKDKADKPTSSLFNFADGLPPDSPADTGARDRKQVNVAKGDYDMLEQYAEVSGKKVAQLTTEAFEIYVKLMADKTNRGQMMESRTSNRLSRLRIEYDIPTGDIVRASTAIGCELLEASVDPSGDERDLFNTLVDEARKSGKKVPDFVVELVRAALVARRGSAK